MKKRTIAFSFAVSLVLMLSASCGQFSSSAQTATGTDIATTDSSFASTDSGSLSSIFDNLSGSSFAAMFALAGYSGELRKRILKEKVAGEEDSAQSADILQSLYDTMATTRRDQLAVLLDILVLAQQPMYRKRILQSANLSYSQMSRYLEFLLSRGLIREEPVGLSRLFVTTKKGLEFMRMLTSSD